MGQGPAVPTCTHNGLAIRHTSATNQGGPWNDNDPDLEPVLEIFQGTRTSSEQAGGPLVTNPATAWETVAETPGRGTPGELCAGGDQP
jgi:hypothetical protein